MQARSDEDKDRSRGRLRRIREAFGHGLGMRAWARRLGLDENVYLSWESTRGVAPDPKRLAQGLRNVPEIHDPEQLAVWAGASVGTFDEARLFDGASVFRVADPARMRDILRLLEERRITADEAAVLIARTSSSASVAA